MIFWGNFIEGKREGEFEVENQKGEIKKVITENDEILEVIN